MGSDISNDEPADDGREPSLRDVLDAMRVIDGTEVTAAEIRIVLGCSVSTARRRLDELFERGKLDREESGQQVVWWQSDAERTTQESAVDRYAPADGPATDAVKLIESSRDEP
jgi:predicted HTH transcriptional regulator